MVVAIDPWKYYTISIIFDIESKNVNWTGNKSVSNWLDNFRAPHGYVDFSARIYTPESNSGIESLNMAEYDNRRQRYNSSEVWGWNHL